MNGDDVNSLDASPVDLSAEAALELEELKQGQRNDTPALTELFRFMRTPGPSFQGQSGVSMMADVRSYALFRDTLGPERVPNTNNLADFRKAVERYLGDLEAGVTARRKDQIAEAKQFCLSFNENLLMRQMAEIYHRRERSDSRYVTHELVS
jgi:hypothetical protein